MTIQKRTREQIVAKVAQDIPNGSFVNLGIGLPTRVAGHLKPEQNVILHSENGVLGFAALNDPEQADDDLINAGKELVSMLEGGSFMNSADSFDIMRGGHLDICVMGAFQVAINGDLANWHTGNAAAVPAVGGAMDLAVGARCVYVCMEHVTKNGAAKIVEELTYPITGKHCVNRIYTDLCVIELKDQQARVIEMVEGLSFEELQQQTGCKLLDHRQQ
ncbi:3-oxoacid CoA-transferase subunit B [Acinetobacter sp. YH12200]|uniref:3-oxoacid CoA-transferase subunit B n=1 Tax=Acinetobacter sp. YH12200 TaxID=2601139 RepID=UPI00132F5520|nr:3-oxoacid CoA-transferase subunit B [Acinetobacter sp. YH12200]